MSIQYNSTVPQRALDACSAVTTMASRALSFSFLIVSVHSFVPWIPRVFLVHQGPIRESFLARNQILRDNGDSHPSFSSMYGYAALAVGGSLDATRASTTEGSDYLRNKEELKRVRSIVSVSFTQQGGLKGSIEQFGTLSFGQKKR